MNKKNIFIHLFIFLFCFGFFHFNSYSQIIKLTDQDIVNKWYFNRFSVVAYMRDDIVSNILKNKGKCLNQIDSLGVQIGGKFKSLKYFRKLIDKGYSIDYVIKKLLG